MNVQDLSNPFISQPLKMATELKIHSAQHNKERKTGEHNKRLIPLIFLIQLSLRRCFLRMKIFPSAALMWIINAMIVN